MATQAAVGARAHRRECALPTHGAPHQRPHPAPQALRPDSVSKRTAHSLTHPRWLAPSPPRPCCIPISQSDDKPPPAVAAAAATAAAAAAAN